MNNIDLDVRSLLSIMFLLWFIQPANAAKIEWQPRGRKNLIISAGTLDVIYPYQEKTLMPTFSLSGKELDEVRSCLKIIASNKIKSGIAACDATKGTPFIFKTDTATVYAFPNGTSVGFHHEYTGDLFEDCKSLRDYSYTDKTPLRSLLKKAMHRAESTGRLRNQATNKPFSFKFDYAPMDPVRAFNWSDIGISELNSISKPQLTISCTVFSGRPDPEFTISGEALQEVRKSLIGITELGKAEQHNYNMRFSFRTDGGYVSVSKECITLGSDAGSRSYSDKHKLWDQLNVAKAKALATHSMIDPMTSKPFTGRF